MAISRTELLRILAEADPAGLVADGGGRNAYAAEADEIITIANPTVTDITTVFSASFSEPGICSREVAGWIQEEMRRRDGGR